MRLAPKGGLLRPALKHGQQRVLHLLEQLARGTYIAQAVLADLVDSAFAVDSPNLAPVDRALGTLHIKATAPEVKGVILPHRAVKVKHLHEVKSRIVSRQEEEALALVVKYARLVCLP